MYEDSICGGCGQSTIHSLDEKNTGRYEVETVVCQGCAAQPVDPPKYAHGEQAYVTSTLSEDGDVFVHEGDIPGHHRPPVGAVYDDPGDYDNEEDGDN